MILLKLHKNGNSEVVSLCDSNLIGKTFEDSENGISSAKNAGLYSVGFRNGFNNNQKLERADMIIEDFNDLNLEILITKFL